MSVCLNHPDRIAFAKCRSCGTPICEECNVSTKLGDYCSEKCMEQAKRFHEQFPGGIPPKKRAWVNFKKFVFGGLGLIMALALAFVVIAVLWGGSDSAPDFIKEIYEMGKGLLG